jgi:MSHA biogenesis protein MshL
MRFWKDLEKTITDMVGRENGRSITVNALTGIVSVRAYPAELNSVNHYINSLQTSLNRQVILEAKILEVQLNDEYQAGIDWSVLGNPAAVPQLDANGNPISSAAGMGQAGNQTFPDTTLTDFASIFAIKVNGNFTALVKLLESQGNVQILSSPHISTVNNEKAVIKVGSDQFFVTGVSTSNTIIGSNTLPSQDVTLTPFFSGITLDVTPEISSDSTVVLHIHPSVSVVTEQTKVIGLGTGTSGAPNNLTLPLANSTIRESDNIVRAKNGQVVVIGGLMQNNMIETVVATPWLGHIPFIGAAFRRTQQTSAKSELVILLRPIVVTNASIVDRLEESKKSFQILKRPFHTGSLPKTFGNEAERANDY